MKAIALALLFPFLAVAEDCVFCPGTVPSSDVSSIFRSRLRHEAKELDLSSWYMRHLANQDALRGEQPIIIYRFSDPYQATTQRIIDSLPASNPYAPKPIRIYEIGR